MKKKRIAVKIMPEIELLADKTNILNEEKNRLIQEYNRTRKELFTLMLKEGVKDLTTKNGIRAFLDAPERALIDVYKLKDLTDDETFLKIVSATQRSVTEHIGTAVLTQCSVMKQGEQNVKTKKV